MRLLGFLILLALIVGAVGYFRGWISFTSETLGGEKKVSLSIDKDGLNEDLTKARSKVTDLLDKVGKGNVSGTVESVDTANQKMVVKTADGESIVLDLPDGIETQLDGAASQLSSLQAGDTITLEIDDAKIQRILGKRD